MVYITPHHIVILELKTEKDANSTTLYVAVYIGKNSKCMQTLLCIFIENVAIFTEILK